ncbi:MAG: hypothetical protein LQ344_007223 [Seirophora lacunosa]|nr:MAG: hypothetical protein LQ344_007223 [Seirophora lacunosa]
MSVSTFKSVHLAERPKDSIIPGETFTLKTGEAPKESDLKDGEVLFQSLYLSLDPAMRGWLNDTRSYIPPVQIGEVMRGAAVGVVKASKSDAFPVGSYATGTVGWTELAVMPGEQLEKVDIPRNGKITDALGVLGLTGLTAYFGLLEVGKVKAGDFVVVSGAAGATGSVVGQIAKIKGATVLGIAGSNDKVRWLRDELGFDDALNYKDQDFPKKFKDATKDLINVFFDNVGGEVLDLALSRAKPHARFVICGGPSLLNYLNIISMRIRMEGFIVFDYSSSYPSARAQLALWLAEGKIQRKETIIAGGLEKAEQALVDLYDGVNTGKLLVEVHPADDDSSSSSSASAKKANL